MTGTERGSRKYSCDYSKFVPLNDEFRHQNRRTKMKALLLGIACVAYLISSVAETRDRALSFS